MKKEIKNLSIIYTLVLFLIVLIAVTVGIVSSFNPSPENTGLIGAILSGIIAGSLTLLGVYLTIEQQKTKEFLNKYPQLKNNAEEILDSLNDIINLLNTYNEENKKSIIASVIDFSEKEIDSLRVKSIPCGGRVFSEIMKIKKTLNAFVTQARADVNIRSDGGGSYIVGYYATDENMEDFIKELTVSKERIYEEINKEEEKFNSFYNLWF